MKIFNLKTKIISLLAGIALFAAGTAKAVCPVCVVAVGAGLGFSRWLGVDDVVSSLWIGGILAALSIWTIGWLRRKGWGFKFDDVVIWLAYYGLVLLPLYLADITGHPYNKIWGIDKILFGTVAGTLIFVAAAWLNNYLKKKNGDKVYFPYQKVVIPFGILLIFSIILYFLLSWKII